MALYSAPSTPNYNAAATTDVNTNRSNQVTPFGSQTWLPPTTPGGQWTQTTTLTPAEQAAAGSQQNVAKNLSGGAAAMTPWAVGNESGPMDYSKFTAGGAPVQTGNYYDKAAGDAVYGQFSSRMEPQFARDTAAAETQMRNQGLSPGDEAWQDQMRQLQQSQGDQRDQAMRDATSTAATEGSRMQGMDVSAGNYNTSQRNDQIAQELEKRGYGAQEIQDLLKGQSVGMPSMPAAPNLGDPYSKARADTYGAQTDAANASNASTGSWLNLAAKGLTTPFGPGGSTLGGDIASKVGSWLGFSPAGAAALPTSAAGAAVAGGDAAALGAADGSAFAAAPAFEMAGAVPAADAAGTGAAAAGTGAAAGSWLPAAGVAGAAIGAGIGVDKIGDHYNWWGNNNPSRIGATNVPQGAQQWAAPNGDNIIGIPSASGATLAAQVNHGKAPGDPVLYSKTGDPKTGAGGWELKGFRKGNDTALTNQKTGQTMSITDPAFQTTFGLTPQQFQQMYAKLTSSYVQGH